MDNGKLDFDEYQQHALRTAGVKEGNEAVSMGGMGLGGETAELLELFLDAQESFLKVVRLSVNAGKLVDYLKKVAHHAHVLDKEKVKKELGDVLWYVALVAHVADLKLDDVAQTNVEKLKARYAKGFTTAESLNRKPGDQ